MRVLSEEESCWDDVRSWGSWGAEVLAVDMVWGGAGRDGAGCWWTGDDPFGWAVRREMG